MFITSFSLEQIKTKAKIQREKKFYSMESYFSDHSKGARRIYKEKKTFFRAYIKPIERHYSPYEFNNFNYKNTKKKKINCIWWYAIAI